MFGQHDDQSQQSQDTTSQTPMSGVDDSIATPTDSSMMASAGAPAASMNDQDMPGFEPTGNGDGVNTADMPASYRVSANTPEELISIKQEALQSLKPLVGHLQQSPEEKFRTAMMMIQASDDQSLIPEAYNAAKSIEDEKTRAQALLDVVNEINYFTAQNTQQQA